MSIRQPVSWLASRTFWPFLPIASESLSSGTISSMRWPSASMMTRETSAGAIALQTKRAGSSSYGTMSIFSAQLLHDGLHAAALHADARADRVDVAIARRDGDLRAGTRLARARLDAD